MELRRLSSDKKQIKQVRKLYYDAFPRIERAPFGMLVRRNRQGRGDFWNLCTGDEWVGFAYVVANDRVAYIFYLAIRAEKRNTGLGSEAIKAIVDFYQDKKVFLALEKLDEEAENYSIRKRRFGFYSRNGLTVLNRSISEGGVEFAVMSIGGDINPEEYSGLMLPFAGKFYMKLYDMNMK